ncbi:hypothetical protein OH76DRAFT_194935 [Lentinus brumalis]|uniref:BTB domain-containing protein n=1 Tax=Lentinus brumalis TaxID=2498619 RepID=A0A371DI22_9APHY|nr:hypothetical protein OH76DRAFT_194935 [Polyporus brumalis]
MYAKAPAFARRPKPQVAPIFPPLDARSAEFWYPDGNIVVSVEGTYFRLLQSRLERHCGYFTNPLWSTINGQKVVEVQDIKLHDFEMFLRYLEVPMEHAVKDAPNKTALSLLRASRVLSCKLIGDLAQARILGPWSSVSVPSPGDKLSGRPYRQAFRMLKLAQDVEAPLARKQALYALLADAHFWLDVTSQRAEVAISDADLLLLYRARVAMQEKWRVHVLTPPKAGPNCGCLSDEGTRAALWSGQMAKYATTEVRDPFRSIVGVRNAVRKLVYWCGACVNERTRALEEARNLWWQELDELLGIVVPAA